MRSPEAGVSRTAHPTRSPGVSGPRVELRVLGSFDAVRGDQPLELGGPRQQAVLARLLIADDAVRMDQIVEDLWGGSAPPTAVGTVHAYVSRLRKVLGADVLCRSAAGYRLDRSRVDVDALTFQREAGRGIDALADGDLPGASEWLQRALSRWTGEAAFGALHDLVFVEPVAHQLAELHLSAAEALADAEFGLGRPEHSAPLLLGLVGRCPLRESLVLRLVRALYAAGRPAEALTAYDRCRHALADELGVDPSPALQDLYGAVLAQRPLERPAPAAVRPAPPTPWWLPPRNRAFAGRERVLRDAEAELGGATGAPRVLVLHGLGGVGKTELALELAHRRRAEHTVTWWVRADGTAATATGLADLARALQLPDRARQEELVTALWDLLDSRGRWLVVFDNADDPDALAPFLPSTGDGEVIVTSRNPAWRRLGVPLAVPPFDRGESRRFLAARSGDPDAAAADGVAEVLGDLPLALEQASAYVEQTGIALGDYLRLLDRQQTELLTRRFAGGNRPSVATTWGLAFDGVRSRSPEAARLLETLAFLAPDGIPVGLLAAGDDDELTVNDRAAELLRFSLVDRDHDLLRVHRLVQAAVRAQLGPTDRRDRLETAIGLVAACAGDPDTANWDALAPHTVALAAHAVVDRDAAGLARPLLRLLLPCAMWLAGRALFPAALEELRNAVRLARATGDPVSEGSARSVLGEVLDRHGDTAEARLELERAVAMLEGELGPQDLRLAHAHNRLGHVLNCAGEPAGAVAALERALGLFRLAGQPVPLARASTDLGYTRWATGDLPAARRAFRESITLLEAMTPPHPLLAHTIAGLGLVEQDSGNLTAALDCQTRALDLFTTLYGPRHPDVAQSYDKLGFLRRLLGDAAGAVEAHERAVADLRSVFGAQDPRVAMALTNAGLAYRDAGRPGDARAAQQRAYDALRAHYGDAHPSAQLAARRLGVALAEDGAAPAGRHLAEAAFRHVRSTHGADSPEAARAAIDLATVLDLLGESAEADQQRRWALDIFCDAFGPDHPESRALADVLGCTTVSHPAASSMR